MRHWRHKSELSEEAEVEPGKESEGDQRDHSGDVQGAGGGPSGQAVGV